MTDDPDETEGRLLYRQRADALARAQTKMAERSVKLRKPEDDEGLPPGVDHEAEYLRQRREHPYE